MSSDDPELRDEGPASEDAFARLLREAALDEPKLKSDLLSGVQNRIRDRSRGRFYGDRWSLARVSPVLTYLVTALLMLTILGLSYFMLRPLLEAGSVVPSPVKGSSEPARK